MEYATGAFLSDTVLGCAELQEIHQAISVFGSLVNDLVSFDNEIRRDGGEVNVLYFLMRFNLFLVTWRSMS